MTYAPIVVHTPLFTRSPALLQVKDSLVDERLPIQDFCLMKKGREIAP